MCLCLVVDDAALQRNLFMARSFACTIFYCQTEDNLYLLISLNDCPVVFLKQKSN